MKHWLGQQEVGEHGLYEPREEEQVAQVGGEAKLGKVQQGGGHQQVGEEVGDHGHHQERWDPLATRQHSSNST